MKTDGLLERSGRIQRGRLFHSHHHGVRPIVPALSVRQMRNAIIVGSRIALSHGSSNGTEQGEEDVYHDLHGVEPHGDFRPQLGKIE